MSSTPASTPPLLPENLLATGVIVDVRIGAEAPVAQRPTTTAFQRRMERAPDWFCSFLAGNTREKTRFRTELATMKGSVVWLVRQRRLGAWTSTEREHLKSVMRSASSVSPYLVIWVVPGSLLMLPFMAWFLDRRRRRKGAATDAAPASEPGLTIDYHRQ